MNLSDLIPQLLGRPFPEPVFDLNTLGMKCALVSGAGGSIGSEVCVQLAALNIPTLILFELNEYSLYTIEQTIRGSGYKGQLIPVLGDVGNPHLIKSVLRTFDVDTVIHTAAYKHVPLVERNPLMGVRNNFLGTSTIAKAAVHCGVARFLFVSTDKAVRPTNVMGASKRLAEWACLGLKGGKTQFRVVRFGNVMGSSGSVLPLFQRQLSTTGVVTITHPEVTRFFMSVQEAVSLVLQSQCLPEGTYVFDMGKPVVIEEMAHRMAKLMKVKKYSIKHVGLRPGEKLYEELTLGEKLHKTDHPMIQQAIEDFSPTWNTELRAVQLIAHGDAAGLRALLLDTVPGYKPMCGIVDDVWLEDTRRCFESKLDDCFKDTEPAEAQTI